MPRGRRVRQKSARTKASSDEARDAIDEPAQTEVPLAPQFFIMRGDEEVGPLPRQAIEELADDGSILSDTPVRLEESEQWSTAAAVGFHCSASMPTGLAPDVMKDPAGMNHAVGIAWLAFAPYYFVTGVARLPALIRVERRSGEWPFLLWVFLLSVGCVRGLRPRCTA